MSIKNPSDLTGCAVSGNSSIYTYISFMFTPAPSFWMALETEQDLVHVRDCPVTDNSVIAVYFVFIIGLH